MSSSHGEWNSFKIGIVTRIPGLHLRWEGLRREGRPGLAALPAYCNAVRKSVLAALGAVDAKSLAGVTTVKVGSAKRRSRNPRRGMAILAMNITGRMPVPRRV